MRRSGAPGQPEDSNTPSILSDFAARLRCIREFLFFLFDDTRMMTEWDDAARSKSFRESFYNG